MDKFHFIGIKGAGMSALAQVLHDTGHPVQGSDVETEFFTQKPLEQRGIPLFRFGDDEVAANGTRVIASNAFKDDHPEIVRYAERGVAVERYHHFLGDWLRRFTSFAVTGAHGKTSTTGMLAHTFSGLHPTSYLIGDGTGSGVPGSKYFIFESCEYRRHFLAYEPDYAIITNIDFDHPDYFTGLDDVTRAFQEMANRVRKHLIACGDDPQVRKLKPGVPVLHYGFGDHNALRADHVRSGPEGMTFDVHLHGNPLGAFTVAAYGRHSVLNALAVIGAAVLEDLNIDDVKRRLATFGGVKRRFSEKNVRGNILIDDYAHHPTEIAATLDAVRSKYPGKKVVSVFQPHTYSRLETFLDEFAESLSGSDEVYLCSIFGSAREQSGGVTIERLIEKIPESRYIAENSIDQLNGYSDCVLLFMGAGDIQKYQTWYERA
ncbi:UDP-N-acetylmuramate--L-alanine ligase [Paenibacillus flagellatus]|uniref:UDP-N-acetylmuramate--L-alanine ligase n=1 Tax=Paenibacillus flagellatus TaxID=2211139 RepID=A0A2V5KAG9_9BACL|nr:UDP-N-acetylmuramate--L-alanine ligase [Paenibacillus flagellatus]PYI55902.1 UDP-N-acetylmuramate--L-alanine ligase [Paenibacillus flagellatus]